MPGSMVTIQFDMGCVSPVTMVACESTLMWSPDPEAIECTSLNTPTFITCELSSCCMDNVYSVLILHYKVPPPANELHLKCSVTHLEHVHFVPITSQLQLNFLLSNL